MSNFVAWGRSVGNCSGLMVFPPSLSGLVVFPPGVEAWFGGGVVRVGRLGGRAVGERCRGEAGGVGMQVLHTYIHTWYIKACCAPELD